MSTTDLTTTTTGGFTATSSSAAFTTAITGNFIYLSGGTGGTVTSGWYEATYASATTITLDRSPGAAATAVSMNIGGGLHTLSQLATNLAITQGMIGYVKAESAYSISTGVTFSGAGSTSVNNRVIGYTTSRGDLGQPEIQATAAITAVTLNVKFLLF